MYGWRHQIRDLPVYGQSQRTPVRENPKDGLHSTNYDSSRVFHVRCKLDGIRTGGTWCGTISIGLKKPTYIQRHFTEKISNHPKDEYNDSDVNLIF